MSQTHPEPEQRSFADQTPFHLGAWRVEPGSGQLSRDETLVRVEPKAMDVLVYLAAHQGEVVSREELERGVWHGALVGYDAVTSTVIKLRKALGDDARHPRYIATVPKRGYRLLPPVDLDPQVADDPRRPTADPLASGPPVPKPVPGKSWAKIGAAVGVLLALMLAVAMWSSTATKQRPEALVPRTPDLPTLAVLPFSNLGEGHEQQYFTDGVTEDVIAGLSKLSGLRVIARNSAFAFAGAQTDPQEAAALLGVRYVLQGSVRRSGETLRVTAKLIDAASGVHLWGEQFDGGVRDVFALQDRVAEGTVAPSTSGR